MYKANHTEQLKSKQTGVGSLFTQPSVMSEEV